MVSLMLQVFLVIGLTLGVVLLSAIATLIKKFLKPSTVLSIEIHKIIFVLNILTVISLSSLVFLSTCGDYPYANCNASEFGVLVGLSLLGLPLPIAGSYLGILIGYGIYKIFARNEVKQAPIDPTITPSVPPTTSI